MLRLDLPPTGENDILDITGLVEDIIREKKFLNGAVLIFVPGSTGALSTLEYEPGLLKDIPIALERLFPKGITYQHDETWHDGNGHSHIRATFIGPSLTLPVCEGKLVLGTWQQIVFLEFDNKHRKRWLSLQFFKESFESQN
ncbi:MAG TPA: YjbQ family protein [Euryarchaeota archaeon]|nr:YjbQ family protein [Euryarchaeota archaeon]